MRSITIKVDDALLPALEERTGDDWGEGLPSVVKSAAERYLQVCRYDLPELAPREWRLVMDALNGTIMDWFGSSFGSSGRTLAAIQVEDAIRLNGLDRKWDVDGTALVTKLRSLTYGQALALSDFVERWWKRASSKNELPIPGEEKQTPTHKKGAKRGRP